MKHIRKSILIVFTFIVTTIGIWNTHNVYAKESVNEKYIQPPTLSQSVSGFTDTNKVDVDSIINESLNSHLATQSPVLSMNSSELNPPIYWNLSITGKTIKWIIHANELQENADVYAYVYRGTSRSGTLKKRNQAELINGVSEVNVSVTDTATYANGKYTLQFWIKPKSASSKEYITECTFQISSSGVEFTDPGCGSHEKEFIATLNADYDPEKYNQVPERFYPEAGTRYAASNLNEIIAKAKELTKDCTTDEQKVRVIHDWICTNLPYDYVSYNAGDWTDAANAGWAFENKRAVCSGFARIGQIMFTTVGIPCLLVDGYANDPVTTANITQATNHEWNVIYIDGSWRNIDMTWDNLNKYYGDSNAQTTLNNLPKYTYYGSPAFNFGGTHISQEMYTDERYVESLSFSKQPTKLHFNVNDSFSFDGSILINYSDGTRAIHTAGIVMNHGYCSGYNMSMESKQTVTISYAGKTITYDITVGNPCKNGHTPSNWIVIKQPTYTQKGSRYKKCTVCETILETEEIPCVEKPTTEAPTTEKPTTQQPTTERRTTETPTTGKPTTERVTTEKTTTEKITTERRTTERVTTETTTEKPTTQRPTAESNNDIESVANSVEVQYIVTKQAEYKVTKDTGVRTVSYQAPANSSGKIRNDVEIVVIPKIIKIENRTYKVTAIADNAFSNCKKLKKITIESNVLKIGKKAFYGCGKLKTITIKSKKLKLQNVGKNAFKGIHRKAKIKVPASKVKAYQSILRKRGVSSKTKIRK